MKRGQREVLGSLGRQPMGLAPEGQLHLGVGARARFRPGGRVGLEIGRLRRRFVRGRRSHEHGTAENIVKIIASPRGEELSGYGFDRELSSGTTRTIPTAASTNLSTPPRPEMIVLPSGA